MEKNKIILFFLLVGLIVSCRDKGFTKEDEGNGESEFPENLVVTFDMQYLNQLNAGIYEDARTIWEHVHTAATLQGVVNREKPQLYLFYVESEMGGVHIDRYWWDKYRQSGKWMGQMETEPVKSIFDLVDKFRHGIKGAVVYDPKVPATSSIASSIAGIEDLIAVCYNPSPNSLYSKLIVNGPKIPVKVWLLNEDGTSMFTGSATGGTAKTEVYKWYIENYMSKGKCNTAYGAYYIDQYWLRHLNVAPVNHHTLTNHDFFVSKKAFFFDLSPWADESATDDPGQAAGADLEILKEMLQLAYHQNSNGKIFTYIGGFPAWRFKYTELDGGRYGAVESEWEYARIISAYNAFKDADATGPESHGALANASFWQHYPLKNEYPQKWITRDELKTKGYLDAEGKLSLGNKKLLVFYVGDYDASSWLSQSTPTIWDDPNRGKVPMMWAISPILAERVPMAWEYRVETATANDYFVAADNGAGYLNPGMLQAPRPVSGLPDATQDWANHCLPHYQKWGLTVSGFVIDGYGLGLNRDGLDAYASFSPNGMVRQDVESYAWLFPDGLEPHPVPLTQLHNNMPILREGGHVNEDPVADAATVVRMVNEYPIPFFWVRNILKSPTWYVTIVEEMKRLDPDIELVDAPTFFELYRIYLNEKKNTNNVIK